MDISKLVTQSLYAALGLGAATAAGPGQPPRARGVPVGLRSIGRAADSFTPARLGDLMRGFGIKELDITVATQESARIMEEQVALFLGNIARRADGLPPLERQPGPAPRHGALAEMTHEQYLEFMHDRDHYVGIGQKNALALIGGSASNKRPVYLRDHDHASSAGDDASSAGDSDQFDDDDQHG